MSRGGNAAMSCLLLLGWVTLVSKVEAQPRSSTPPSTTEGDSTALTTGDPVSASSGEYSFSRTLFDLGGPLPLDYRLYYGSHQDIKQGRDGLPFRFSSNHALLLLQLKFSEPDELFINLGLGREVGFGRTASGWELFSFEDFGYELKETAGLFYLLDPVDQLVYTFRKEFENATNVSALAVGVEDRNGNRLSYEYPSGNERLSRGPDRVRDSLGRELRFTYQSVGTLDPFPYLVRVEDQAGRAWSLAYDEAPGDNANPSLAVGFGSLTLRSLTDPQGNTTTFRYADRDRIASETRPRGNNPFTQVYDPAFIDNGVVSSQTDAFGNTMLIQADQLQARREQVQVNGVPTLRRVVSDESRFTVTFPDGSRQLFRHTKGSRVIRSLTDPLGREAVFESDPQRERITEAPGAHRDQPAAFHVCRPLGHPPGRGYGCALPHAGPLL